MKKFKFVIIGVGSIGSKYAELLDGMHNAELIAAVDIDFSKRKNTLKLIPFFTDLDHFLSLNLPADVICVCTPNGLHATHTISCIEAGYHVICEKPVALKPEDIEKMMEVEKFHHKKVFAVMQNRYSPVSIWLKNIINKHSIGDIKYIQVNCFWNRSERYYTEARWRATKKLGGGPLYTQFCHFIDLMIWLTGEPKNVQSESYHLNDNIKTEFDDSGIVRFDTEFGGKGVFNYSTAAWGSNVESSLTLLGSKGNIKIGGQYMEKLEYINLENPVQIPVFDQVSKVNQYEYYQGSADKHDVLLKKVIHCLENNLDPEITLKDGLRVIEFIEKATISVQSKNY